MGFMKVVVAFGYCLLNHKKHLGVSATFGAHFAASQVRFWKIPGD
jgi:hypothetical protein